MWLRIGALIAHTVDTNTKIGRTTSILGTWKENFRCFAKTKTAEKNSSARTKQKSNLRRPNKCLGKKAGIPAFCTYR